MGLAEDLLRINAFQPIAIDEWPDRKVTLRKISGLERQQCAEVVESDTSKSKVLMMATYVAIFLGDEYGKRVFSDAQITDVQNLPAAIQDRIFYDGLAYNKIREKDQTDAKKD